MTSQQQTRMFYLRIPEGSIHGPVGESDLRRWVIEGRVDPRCEIRGSEDERWMASEIWFPILRLPSSVAAGSPFKGVETSLGSESKSRVPHRGVVVLLLGTLGMIAACPIFSLMAWGMASADLAEMQAGKMDKTGHNLTVLGYYLGMTGGLLWLMGILVILGFGILVLTG
ncbi:MAG: hypothetical protein WD045_01505 [Pirellulaceae bacterium]